MAAWLVAVPTEIYEVPEMAWPRQPGDTARRVVVRVLVVVSALVLVVGPATAAPLEPETTSVDPSVVVGSPLWPGERGGPQRESRSDLIGPVTNALLDEEPIDLTALGLRPVSFPSALAIGADGTVYLAGWDSQLVAVRADGTLKWRSDVLVCDINVCRVMAGPDGTIVVGGTFATRMFRDDGDGATLLWTATGGNRDTLLGPDGTVYVSHCGGGCQLTAYLDDPLTPELPDVRWSRQIGLNIHLSATGSLAMSRSGSTIYASGQVRIHAFDVETGAAREANGGQTLLSVATDGSVQSFFGNSIGRYEDPGSFGPEGSPGSLTAGSLLPDVCGVDFENVSSVSPRAFGVRPDGLLVAAAAVGQLSGPVGVLSVHSPDTTPAGLTACSTTFFPGSHFEEFLLDAAGHLFAALQVSETQATIVAFDDDLQPKWQSADLGLRRIYDLALGQDGVLYATAFRPADARFLLLRIGPGGSGADTTSPVADFQRPNEDTTTIQRETTIDVSWSESDEGGSGIAERSLQRERGAVATPASCDGLTFTIEGPPLAVSSPVTVSNLAHGYCYRWTVSLLDGAGNRGSQTSGSVLVDTEGPLVDETFDDALLVTGRPHVFEDVSDAGCLAGGMLSVEPTIGTAAPWEVALSPAQPCGPGLALDEAKLVPGTYDVELTASDVAGNPPSKRVGRITVAPTERVVILLQGITSEGLPLAGNDCAGGLPASDLPDPGDAQVVGNAINLSSGLAALAHRGGVPLRELTVYVLDYPLGEALGDYCFADDSDLPFRGLILPRYQRFDTTRGIDSESAVYRHLKSLISSFPDNTVVDLVGHSQGGVLAGYWLATASGPELDKLHAVHTWDSPLGGLGSPEIGLFCLKEVGLDPALRRECRGWQSWDDLARDSLVIGAVMDPSRTTQRALVATLTCEVFCVGDFPGARDGELSNTTLRGVWHHYEHVCGVEPKWNHGCFYESSVALGMTALLISAEVTDTRDLPRSRAWTNVTRDDFVRRSGLRPLRAESTYTFTFQAEEGQRAVLYFDHTDRSCDLPAGIVALSLNGGPPVTQIGGQIADHRDGRPEFCRFDLDGELILGSNTLTVTPSDRFFVVDAVEVVPPS